MLMTAQTQGANDQIVWPHLSAFLRSANSRLTDRHKDGHLTLQGREMTFTSKVPSNLGYLCWSVNSKGFFLILNKILFILFLSALGLLLIAQVFSSFGERGLLSRCSVQVSHCGVFFHRWSTGSITVSCMGFVALWHVKSSPTRD